MYFYNMENYNKKTLKMSLKMIKEVLIKKFLSTDKKKKEYVYRI